MTLLEAIGMTQGFVFLKSCNDSVYIKNRKVIPTHGLEWVMVAWVSTIAGMGLSNDWLVIGAFDLLMAAVTWILMDLELNALLLKNWITYQGSGGIDLWFKSNTSHPVRSMWVAKVALVGIVALIFFYSTAISF